MKTILLDGAGLTHDTLAAAFRFPDYYGRNLDALYDCLGDVRRDVAVVISRPDAAPDPRFLTVLRDAAAHNPHILLTIHG